MRIQSETEFTNLYLFVSDALRFDHVPDPVTADATPVRTISSSGVSCAAFSTLVSGLYPPQHGVWTFSDLLPNDTVSIYDLFSRECPSHQVVFALTGARENAVYYSNVHEFVERMETVEEPFFIFDRELCTHGGYGFDHGNSAPDPSEQVFEDTSDYWADRGADEETIHEDYQRGAELAAKRFEDRLDILRRRGILDDTLIVFTADHGEALGEHGMYGHTNVPLAPEVVEVPTVFYNDDVSVEAEDPFMAHVDLLPTLAHLIGRDGEVPANLPGYDLVSGAPRDRMIFNADRRRGGLVFGAWDRCGAHTFSTEPMHLRLARAGERLTLNNQAPIHRQHLDKILSLPFAQDRTFGDPLHSRDEARAFCDEVLDTSTPSSSRHLDADAKSRLRALGYVDEDIE